MNNLDILEMYKNGHSIDFIVNTYYLSQKRENKVMNAYTRQIILIKNNVSKKDARSHVYKIIYTDLKQKDRPI